MSYDSAYYTDGDSDFLAFKEYVYQNGYTANSALWREGAIDKRFVTGDQNLLSLVYGDNTWAGKRRFYFNLIRRNINMIAGYQRQHRKSGVVIPDREEYQALADDYTKLSLWSERREGFQEYLSQAFELGALQVGQGFLELYPDYTLDPISGDLCCDYVSYNGLLIDPWWRKMDLSDCGYIWRRQWVDRNEAMRRLPGRAKDIARLKPDGVRDGKFPMQAEAILADCKNLFTYDEVYYITTRKASMIVDPYTSEAVEWTEETDEVRNEKRRILQSQPWLREYKVDKPTIRLGITLGGQTMYKGPTQLGLDRYPFIPIMCYHDPDVASYSWRVQGVVRNLRDAQYLYNRRRIIELDILESQINSGYKYKVGAVTDEACFRQTGQGFLIPIDRNAQMTDVERIDAPGIPPTMMELSRSLAEDITKISGVSDELLGMADDDKAGILALARQGASLVTLQTIFDKLDYSHKLYIQLRLEAIRKNWTDTKVAKILGRNPAPNWRRVDSQRFHVVVEQGTYSATQQQMELRQLLHFRELGIPIPDATIIKAAQIQNKDDLLQELQKQAQQEQQQMQQQMQMQAQQAQVQGMLDQSKAQADQARAEDLRTSSIERVARIDVIHAQAEKDRAQAGLALVDQLLRLEQVGPQWQQLEHEREQLPINQ